MNRLCRQLRNERGVAMITAIMLSFLAMIIILALLYVVSQGTKTSAASKRYKSALEASYGGTEVFTKYFIPQLSGSTTTSLTAVLVGTAPTFGDTNCINDKMNKVMKDWGACSSAAKTDNPKQAPDATFSLRGPAGQANFNVYAKIVDTQPGNSDNTAGTESLDSASGVAYAASGVAPKHMPATYRIEIRGERTTNPLEKANLSVLYAY
jgi:hypothetical protein